MNVERDVLYQLAVGGGATLLFIAMVVVVGVREGNRGLSPDGAMTLIGVIVAFVVLLGALGLALSERMQSD